MHALQYVCLFSLKGRHDIQNILSAVLPSRQLCQLDRQTHKQPGAATMKPITWRIMFHRTPLGTCELKLPGLLDGLEISVMCCLLISEALLCK